MKIQKRIEDRMVEYNDDPLTHRLVYEKVLAFLMEREQFSGEGIMQDDDCLIEAPELLGDLADEIFQFNVIWDE